MKTHSFLVFVYLRSTPPTPISFHLIMIRELKHLWISISRDELVCLNKQKEKFTFGPFVSFIETSFKLISQTIVCFLFKLEMLLFIVNLLFFFSKQWKKNLNVDLRPKWGKRKKMIPQYFVYSFLNEKKKKKDLVYLKSM